MVVVIVVVAGAAAARAAARPGISGAAGAADVAGWALPQVVTTLLPVQQSIAFLKTVPNSTAVRQM